MTRPGGVHPRVLASLEAAERVRLEDLMVAALESSHRRAVVHWEDRSICTIARAEGERCACSWSRPRRHEYHDGAAAAVRAALHSSRELPVRVTGDVVVSFREARVPRWEAGVAWLKREVASPGFRDASMRAVRSGRHSLVARGGGVKVMLIRESGVGGVGEVAQRKSGTVDDVLAVIDDPSGLPGGEFYPDDPEDCVRQATDSTRDVVSWSRDAFRDDVARHAAFWEAAARELVARAWHPSRLAWCLSVDEIDDLAPSLAVSDSALAARLLEARGPGGSRAHDAAVLLRGAGRELVAAHWGPGFWDRMACGTVTPSREPADPAPPNPGFYFHTPLAAARAALGRAGTPAEAFACVRSRERVALEDVGADHALAWLRRRLRDGLAAFPDPLRPWTSEAVVSRASEAATWRSRCALSCCPDTFLIVFDGREEGPLDPTPVLRCCIPRGAHGPGVMGDADGPEEFEAAIASWRAAVGDSPVDCFETLCAVTRIL